MVRNIIKPLAFVLLMIVLLLTAHFAAASNGDFSLQVNIDGKDLSEMEPIVLDPERELIIDLHIFDLTRDIVLDKISVPITFAGQTIHTLSKSMDNLHIAAGGDYREQITVNAKEILKLDGNTLFTGIYPATIKLEYTVDDQKKVWSKPKNIKILGNPLITPLGVAGIVTSGGAVAAILMLIRSLISSGIPAGTIIPGGTSASSLSRFYDLAAGRLEPAARGRVMGNIAKAAKGRIIKKKCPICGTRLKHGYCYTCQNSTKEVRNEYVNRVKALALQSSKLFASGQAVTLDALCSGLEVSARLGTDVMATLRNAKLVKVSGVVRKLMGNAVMAGIGSGLSAVLWITVGGFAVLGVTALVAILAVSIILPITVTKSLQMKARRTLKRHTK